jgi:hypothetical protein
MEKILPLTAATLLFLSSAALAADQKTTPISVEDPQIAKLVGIINSQLVHSIDAIENIVVRVAANGKPTAVQVTTKSASTNTTPIKQAVSKANLGTSVKPSVRRDIKLTFLD